MKKLILTVIFAVMYGIVNGADRSIQVQGENRQNVQGFEYNSGDDRELLFLEIYESMISVACKASQLGEEGLKRECYDEQTELLKESFLKLLYDGKVEQGVYSAKHGSPGNPLIPRQQCALARVKQSFIGAVYVIAGILAGYKNTVLRTSSLGEVIIDTSDVNEWKNKVLMQAQDFFDQRSRKTKRK